MQPTVYPGIELAGFLRFYFQIVLLQNECSNPNPHLQCVAKSVILQSCQNWFRLKLICQYCGIQICMSLLTSEIVLLSMCLLTFLSLNSYLHFVSLTNYFVFLLQFKFLLSIFTSIKEYVVRSKGDGSAVRECMFHVCTFCFSLIF